MAGIYPFVLGAPLFYRKSDTNALHIKILTDIPVAFIVVLFYPNELISRRSISTRLLKQCKKLEKALLEKYRHRW
jgi:hypothetical protein